LSDHTQLEHRMEKDWDERAKRGPFHHVLNRYPIGEWDLDEFYGSGGLDMQRWLDPFCDRNGINTRTRVLLEIGCGVGRQTMHLAQRFKRVIALDISQEMLEVAARMVEADNVTWVKGDGVSLRGLKASSVSFAYSMIVLMHIPDPEIQYAYLAEMGRVLRPGGWFFIQLYNDVEGYATKLPKWQDRAATQELKGWSEAARWELENNRFYTGIQTAVDAERTLAVLAEAGLVVLENEGQGTPLWVLGGRKE